MHTQVHASALILQPSDSEIHLYLRFYLKTAEWQPKGVSKQSERLHSRRPATAAREKTSQWSGGETQREKEGKNEEMEIESGESDRQARVCTYTWQRDFQNKPF